MRLALMAAASVLVLLAATPALAGHCTSYSTSSPEVDSDPSGTLPARVYVDYEPDPYHGWPWDLLLSWVYVEWNGVPGLQRQDPQRDDTCHRMIRPDLLIW